VATLPLTVVGREIYAQSLAQARRLIGKRDPDDIDILALALHFRIPLWSDDRDFEGIGIEQYTTSTLLKRLGISTR
jgi:predicted nucleic acid-binding protein